VTYDPNLEKKGWHRPIPIRISMVLIGLALFLAGNVAWDLESMYGGDPDRQEYVIGWDDELGGAVVLGENGEMVYEATDIDDAEAWVEAQRGSRNYTVPILLIVGSAILVLVGVAPSPRKEQVDDGATPIDVNA
jgi:hypothetical protein